MVGGGEKLRVSIFLIRKAYSREGYPLKKNNVEISVPEVVQPPPPLWKDVPILLPSLGGSGHYYWGLVYSSPPPLQEMAIESVQAT